MGRPQLATSITRIKDSMILIHIHARYASVDIKKPRVTHLTSAKGKQVPVYPIALSPGSDLRSERITGEEPALVY